MGGTEEIIFVGFDLLQNILHFGGMNPFKVPSSDSFWHVLFSSTLHLADTVTLLTQWSQLLHVGKGKPLHCCNHVRGV